MKVIYCPPGEDPLKVARQDRRAGRGQLRLLEYWWVGALAIFIALTFTVGPLKPEKTPERGPDQPPATAEIAINTALVQADPFAGYCKNPAGGWIINGDVVLITDGENTKHVRCTDGTFTETTP